MKPMFALALLAGSAFAATPTFNRDIAPVLYENCAGCHRPGQVAPFSLLTYQDAARRAAQIATVTASRYMPPWKAEPGYGHFQNERRLSDAQIALIRDWAGHGAPEGDTKHKPTPPEFASGWLAGKPDAVLTMPKPFEIPADGRDIFQCFVIPLEFGAERYVKTVEFHPGNSKVVHHSLFFLDVSGEARRLAAASPGSGYPCFGGPRIVPAGGLGGWAPGAIPQPLPSGMGYVIEKGADLVIQLHYHPDGKPETDQSSIGLTFTEEPTKGLTNLTVGARRLDLAPGDAHYEVKEWGIVPQDVELIGITPHAHLLCKDMKVDARFPDGRKESADLDQGLGLQLAGTVPLRGADQAAQGHADRNALRVRQFGRQSAQSVAPSAAREIRRADHRRNGVRFPAGGAAAARRRAGIPPRRNAQPD